MQYVLSILFDRFALQEEKKKKTQLSHKTHKMLLMHKNFVRDWNNCIRSDNYHSPLFFPPIFISCSTVVGIILVISRKQKFYWNHSFHCTVTISNSINAAYLHCSLKQAYGVGHLTPCHKVEIFEDTFGENVSFCTGI